MTLDGRAYQGELQRDGKLHWNDGDVWTRQSRFDGSWNGRGIISGDKLTWKSGPATSLTILSATTLELVLDGRTYCGELQKDGQLHWDDGDIWTQQVPQVGDTIKAKLGQGFIDNDVEFFTAGDEGTITQVYKTDSGQKQFNILWKRTGKSSTYYWASWANAFTVESKTSMCGFSLFDEVQWTGHTQNVPQGGIGIVVGFTQHQIEVQFQKCVLRCSPKELQDLAANVQPVDDKAVVSQQMLCTQESHAPWSAQSLTWAARAQGAPAAGPLEPGPMRKDTANSASPLSTACIGDRASKVCRAQHPGFAATSKQVIKQTGLNAKVPSKGAVVHADRYRGVVKWSRGSIAWLTCDVLAARFPDRDVFLHKSDCNTKLKLWDNVSFQLTLDDQGNPKGIDAIVENSQPAPAPTMISARDWFTEHSKGSRRHKL